MFSTHNNKFCGASFYKTSLYFDKKKPKKIIIVHRRKQLAIHMMTTSVQFFSQNNLVKERVIRFRRQLNYPNTSPQAMVACIGGGKINISFLR